MLGVVGAALVPFPLATASAASNVCMGIVIDYGNSQVPSSPPTSVQGPSVASGTSDLQAMDDAGDSVSQNDSGLVCAINDFPTNGVDNCTTRSGSAFYYWSYWQGDPYTNTWTYANIGPAEHEVQQGQTYVEGWRYQDPGPDSASAPPPSVKPAAAFAQACPGVTPVPKATNSTTPTTTTTPATSTSTSTTATSTTSPTAAPHTGATTTTLTKSHGGTTTTTTKAPVPATTTTPSTTTTTITSPRRHKGTSLGAPPIHPNKGSGDPLLPVLVVTAVIAVLGGLAYFRWRRKPVEE